ncbi:MAG: hypothetical protein V4596_14465 [Bdellovibrionota bacterium]
MKSICAFTILTLVSISSFACPDIRGIWVCGQDSFPQKIDLVQSNGVYNLELRDSVEEDAPVSVSLILDNKDHKIGHGKYKAFCHENEVVVEGSEYMDELKTESIDVKFRYVLMQPNILLMHLLESNEPVFLNSKSEPTTCKRVTL